MKICLSKKPISLFIISSLLLTTLAGLMPAYAVAPVISINDTLEVNAGGIAIISATELDTSDSDTTDDLLIYTIVTTPNNGTLYNETTALVATDTFTQEEINNRLISYKDTAGAGSDTFTFDVTDSVDTVSGTTFNITTLTNSANPSINLNGDEKPVFIENNDPVVIDSDITINDSDLSSDHPNAITSATVIIDNIQDSGSEILSVAPGTNFVASGSESAGEYTLTITGLGSLSDYETILRKVKYENIENNPDTTPDRYVKFSVNDGLNDSSTQSVDVEVVSSNDTASIRFTNSLLEVGQDIKVELKDDDLNTHRGTKEEIILTVENTDSGEEEYIELREDDQDSGTFTGSLDTIDDNDYDDDNDGKMDVEVGDEIIVTYTDEYDSSEDNDDIEATITVGEANEEGDEDSTEETTDNVFPDVDDSVKEKEYIENLANDEIVKGFGDNKFHPYDYVTRGQMATFVVRAFNLSAENNKYCFLDVRIDHTHREDIQTLCNLGIVKGYTDNTYRPDSFVKRDEISKFIVEAMIIKGQSINLNAFLENFPDVDESNKFYQYIAYLTTIEYDNTQIAKGFTDGSFHPESNATRGQMSKMIDLSRKYEESN